MACMTRLRVLAATAHGVLAGAVPHWVRPPQVRLATKLPTGEQGCRGFGAAAGPQSGWRSSPSILLDFDRPRQPLPPSSATVGWGGDLSTNEAATATGLLRPALKVPVALPLSTPLPVTRSCWLRVLPTAMVRATRRDCQLSDSPSPARCHRCRRCDCRVLATAVAGCGDLSAASLPLPCFDPAPVPDAGWLCCRWIPAPLSRLHVP